MAQIKYLRAEGASIAVGSNDEYDLLRLSNGKETKEMKNRKVMYSAPLPLVAGRFKFMYGARRARTQ